VFGLPIGTIDAAVGTQQVKMDDASVTVPLLNAVAAMSHSAEMKWEEEMVQEIRLSKRWLRQNTEASSFSTLAVITAKDDSMAPTFLSGSILLVDTAYTQLKTDGVYVLRKGGEIFIKRIQRNLDGSVEVISDNPAYRPLTIDDPLKTGWLVMGRVLIAMNTHKTI
jgi:phage repressor protein C with HTH and peptisase S24 domain